jgi:hypothetical protein
VAESALWKIIRDLGFRYKNEGRPIIYMDETYIHSSHTKDRAWSDGKNAGLLALVSKGQ